MKKLTLHRETLRLASHEATARHETKQGANWPAQFTEYLPADCLRYPISYSEGTPCC
jgi:hypothetical protein